MELTTNWEYVADTVMGGVSTGAIYEEVIDDKAATVLRGKVSLDNNGGFIQMAFDLVPDGSAFDASAWTGIEIEVTGNGATYEMRLRTTALTRPWQSFRAEFSPTERWQTLRLPFEGFTAHRTDATFDPGDLRRIGILAIGQEFEAEIAVATLRLYRD